MTLDVNPSASRPHPHHGPSLGTRQRVHECRQGRLPSVPDASPVPKLWPSRGSPPSSWSCPAPAASPLSSPARRHPVPALPTRALRCAYWNPGRHSGPPQYLSPSLPPEPSTGSFDSLLRVSCGMSHGPQSSGPKVKTAVVTAARAEAIQLFADQRITMRNVVLTPDGMLHGLGEEGVLTPAATGWASPEGVTRRRTRAG